MGERYDYFRHKYCISFTLNYTYLQSEILPIIDKYKLPKYRQTERGENISILYSIATETIIARSYSVVEKLFKSEGHQEDLIYIPDIFNELHNIYLRSKEQLYKHTVQDGVLCQEVINVVQQTVHYWEQVLNVSNLDFYYTFTLPTHWDYKTREELIWPLFIKAGLINKDDGQGRLIFFTELEAIFRSIQEEGGWGKLNLDMNPGDQYVICKVDVRKYFSVNLELVSANSSSLIAKHTKCTPLLLKEAHFTLPFDMEELIFTSIKTYIKEHHDIILSSEATDMLFERMNSLSKMNDDLFNDKEYNLDEMEIDSIRSIDFKDMYRSVFDPLEKIFKDQMDLLLQGTSNAKDRLMIILQTKIVVERFFLISKCVKNWSEIYSKEQTNSYKLVQNIGEYSDLNDGVKLLVQAQIQEFIICRDPIILSQETVTMQPENSFKPIFFVNIDISFTQTKTDMTYFDEHRQIQQTNNIECNMKSLNNFMVQSEFYQRPVLHITKRLKKRLKSIFGDYLIRYSDANREEINYAIGDNLQTNTKKYQPKGIRKLFASSKPNILQQLMENIEMKDFFMLKNEHCDADNDLVTVCHPGYIFFFMITYLYTLNAQLEEKLDDKFRKDWQVSNIWYGVTVDKDLLDNVFISKKKLEKLFFASGILEKDNDRRKVKFCTRGEEFLPAIQKKLEYLTFKMKSYFMVVQIFPNHVQLTLSQVVKLASAEEHGAEIVIQDEIISINDVYDSLCKMIWNNIHINCQINDCATNNENNNVHGEFGSFQTYSNIYPKLKQYVIKLLQMKKSSLDMDSEIKLNINDICDCYISISLREIIEIGLKSVMADIATIIAASLTNKGLFGNYGIGYIFVLGDPFSLSNNSSIHTAYTMITQQAVDDDVLAKEKDTQVFVLKESFWQLIEGVTHRKPYLYDRFVTGTLCQVSSETYAMRFLASNSDYISFSRIKQNGEIKTTVDGDGSYLVFLQKGKPISTTKYLIKFEAKSRNSMENINIINPRELYCVQKGKYMLLDKDAEGGRYEIFLQKIIFGIQPKVAVECTRLNYKNSFKISAREFGSNLDDEMLMLVEKIMKDPLTLAYI